MIEALLFMAKKWTKNLLLIEKNRVNTILFLKLIFLAVKRKDKPGNFFDGRWHIEYPDAHSAFYSYYEIFLREIYKLDADKNQRLNILDVGANIGMSIMYYRENYPNALIYAYEPDPFIFEILQNNLGRNNVSNATALNCAAWHEATTLSFSQDKSDGGRICDEINSDKLIVISAINICEVLESNHYDFIKIDIEGAENELFSHIAKSLVRCDRIFLEYHSIRNKKQILGDIIKHFSENNYRVTLTSISKNWSPFVKTKATYFDGQYNIWAKR